jgi:fructose-1,6-bisphosphatase I
LGKNQNNFNEPKPAQINDTIYKKFRCIYFVLLYNSSMNRTNHESFYYTLRRLGFEKDLREVIGAMARAGKYINFTLQAGSTDYLETENQSGESQLAVDVESDLIIQHELKNTGMVAQVASEELDKPILHEATRGGAFAVAYDPLDGSSLFDSNLSIGTIFGIWEGDDIYGQKGTDLVASGYIIYGPSVLLVIAGKNLGTHEFEMNDVGEFIIKREHIEIAETSKYFAPGNLRACPENPAYHALISDYIMNKRTLRYSGGMVPDVHHMISKGQGIFLYPESVSNPNGKLRLSFECAPIAQVIEEAGGAAQRSDGTKILDIEITDAHQRTPIIVGSKVDVENAIKALNDPKNASCQTCPVD